jgi:hypothetical protein
MVLVNVPLQAVCESMCAISTRAKMKLNNYCDPNGRPALAAALNMGCPIHCSLGTKAVQQRIVVPLGALV